MESLNNAMIKAMVTSFRKLSLKKDSRFSDAFYYDTKLAPTQSGARLKGGWLYNCAPHATDATRELSTALNCDFFQMGS